MSYCSLGDAFPGVQRAPQFIDPNPPKWAQREVNPDPDLRTLAEQHAESEKCRYLEYLYLKHLQEKYPDPTPPIQNQIEGFSFGNFTVNIPEGLKTLLALIFLGIISLTLLDFSIRYVRPQ